MTDVSTDILIVGAGPAGLAAARAACATSHRPLVTILDENEGPGGQIWRRSAPSWAQSLIARGAEINLRLLPQTTLVHREQDGALVANRGFLTQQSLRIRANAVVLATGARELFLPFPGWTLPGVMGAGGLQAMAKSGFPVAGKRIVIAGTGPLLFAVAAYLQEAGAQIPAIIEQASGRAINRFGLGLVRHPAKLAQAALLRASLRNIPYWTDSWITRAAPGPSGAVGSVFVHRDEPFSRGERELACDAVACGFGLVPNTHLAAMLGCRINHGRVAVDALQQTSAPGIFAAGEAVGIGGVESALVEGAVAGFAAAGDRLAALQRRPAQQKARKFAAALDRAFALRPEVLRLAEDSTICCRCEDVPFGELRRYTSWREAKLQTRCGMGPCQGRICGPIARHVLGFDPVDPRPPVYPVPVGSLAGAAN